MSDWDEESDLPTEANKSKALASGSGWWFAGVFEAFAYLESEFGFRLGELHRHFRGDYVRYDGPTFDLMVDYDPEDTGHIGAALWVHDDLHPTVERSPLRVPQARAFIVNEVLHARDPKLTLPDLDQGGVDRDAALVALMTWAHGLRTLAPDVLRGTWPPDVPLRYMW